MGILYEPRDYLNKECLLPLYYIYIHTYVNNVKLAYASTIRTNLKKIHSQKKHGICINFHKDNFPYTKEFFLQNKAFNVYHLNILNNLIFMHKVTTETASAVLLPNFKNQHIHTQLIFQT